MSVACCSDEIDTRIGYEVVLCAGSAWEGTPYRCYPFGSPELSIARITLAAHTRTKWHIHSMPMAFYVLEGELTLELRDGSRRQIIRAGQASSETVGTEHRGIAGSAPVQLLAFHAGVTAMPLMEVTSHDD